MEIITILAGILKKKILKQDTRSIGLLRNIVIESVSIFFSWVFLRMLVLKYPLSIQTPELDVVFVNRKSNSCLFLIILVFNLYQNLLIFNSYLSSLIEIRWLRFF